MSDWICFSLDFFLVKRYFLSNFEYLLTWLFEIRNLHLLFRRKFSALVLKIFSTLFFHGLILVLVICFSETISLFFYHMGVLALVFFNDSGRMNSLFIVLAKQKKCQKENLILTKVYHKLVKTLTFWFLVFIYPTWYLQKLMSDYFIIKKWKLTRLFFLKVCMIQLNHMKKFINMYHIKLLIV